MTRVLFLHGLESGPSGSKARRLSANPAYTTVVPALPAAPVAAHLQEVFLRDGAFAGPLPDDVAAPSIRAGEDALRAGPFDVVIGSSYGGGIAGKLAFDGTWQGPLVLLAPAARRLFGVERLPARSGRVVILHGRGDDVVPFADSVSLARDSACDVTLRLVDDEHRLSASMERGLLEDLITLALR